MRLPTDNAELPADGDHGHRVDLADEGARVGLLDGTDAQVVRGSGVVGHAEALVLPPRDREKVHALL